MLVRPRPLLKAWLLIAMADLLIFGALTLADRSDWDDGYRSDFFDALGGIVWFWIVFALPAMTVVSLVMVLCSPMAMSRRAILVTAGAASITVVWLIATVYDLLWLEAYVVVGHGLAPAYCMRFVPGKAGGAVGHGAAT
jgi:hypothetical protein